MWLNLYRSVTLSQCLKGAITSTVEGFSFYILCEQPLKERWPNLVFMYGIWRSC